MQTPAHILVVDDDERIRFFLAETLSQEGYVVTQVSNGEDALEQLRDTPFDLAILDLRLGGGVEGMGVLQAIGWRWPAMASIILTGHGSLDSAMAAIRQGIDAYLLKPVKPDQVRRTVREVLDKQQKQRESEPELPESSILRRGRFAADLTRGTVARDGRPLDLSACEYELLVHLMRNDHRTISPKELVRVVRQYECDHLQEARDIIKWYIYRLRRKVEPVPSKPRHILNVRGVGYTFKP